MRKPARLSCAKPSCQRSNCRGNGTYVDSNCWRLLKQRERYQQEAITYQRRSRPTRFWRPGTTPLEKTLIRSLSWGQDGKKSHTTKQWELSRRSRCHNVLPEPDASQSGYDGEDINKGDRYNVNVRSRLVAKEFNNKKCDDLFAGTPPVEAMRAIISTAASRTTPKTLMTVDVSRAYMYAKCRSEMYVEVCPEAHEEDGDEKCCWSLERPCTAREVPRRDWQHEIKRRMLSIGYLQGKSNPCLFCNPSSEVACLVHGDDLLAAGEESALKQFKEHLAKEWMIKYTHIGEAEHLGKHMRVLNRIVRIHPRRGITLEPDPRHAEILIRDLDGDSGRLVTTPMTKDSVKESVESITDRLRECKEREDQRRKTTERTIMTNWMTLRSKSIAYSWQEQIISLWIAATLRSVSSWPVACPHHQDKTGKGFRGWQDTYDTNLGVYFGMYIKARLVKSLASLTATGLDAKGHADPPLVDACFEGHTPSKCGVGHKPW